MMNNKNTPIIGRTIFDWMSENKVIILLIIVFIILMFFYIIFREKHNIKLSDKGLEITPIESVSNKIDTVTKENKPITPKIKDSKTLKTEVKTQETSIIVENQPSNINFGNNSVVGNNINSTITINPKEKLTKDENRKLIEELNLALMSAKRNKKSCVMLLPVSNHPKALELIDDIKPFLINQGYNVVPRNIGMYIINPIPEKKITFNANQGECLHIIISCFN
ncbi:hypothetical protein [Tenacibaculum dicentrarchi]|uniref:hypothetical protein n=1 Tax=Tenacibaculum dicentrarchi TaxID=669041 RepID=UPI000C7C74AD